MPHEQKLFISCAVKLGITVHLQGIPLKRNAIEFSLGEQWVKILCRRIEQVPVFVHRKISRIPQMAGEKFVSFFPQGGI